MGKAPQTILTGQDTWLTIAIELELPETKHSFCIWHIMEKFSGWFLSILRSKYFEWCNNFYRLYRLETVEEFQNKWFITISKKFWVPVYLRSYFFGGMTTTGCSESIKAFIKRYIDSRSILYQFVDIAIESIEQTKMYDTMLDKQSTLVSRVVSPIEEQAQKTLIQFSFKKFKEQLARAG
ncbi:hypothetical protein MKX01_017940 [Papaver californicum]|nr:hypothetical protein MKX01_017940 [Papaver californicum]